MVQVRGVTITISGRAVSSVSSQRLVTLLVAP